MTMACDNQIIGPGAAFVNGKRTGLCGCSTKIEICDKATSCLRADPLLTAHVADHQDRFRCEGRFFIPRGVPSQENQKV